MSLDDIIKTQRSRGRGRGRGGRGVRGVRGGIRGRGTNKARAVGTFTRAFRNPEASSGRNYQGSQVPDGRWEHDKFNGEGFAGRQGSVNSTSKLLVANLDYGVSDSDIKELFGEFGAIRRAAVHYDKSGRSLGSAEVIFERRVDALRALKRYNNIPLDGRPMKIQLVGAAAPGAVAAEVTESAPPVRGTGMRGRGRGGRGRGRGRGGRTEKPTPTAEELDAELDAYVSKMDASA